MITHKVILNTCHRKIYKCIIIMRYSPPIYIVMYKIIFAYVYMDNQLPHDFLSNKVGETVMVEHVYPLLYNCQPSLLLADIQSFYATDCEIEDKYTTEQKPSVLYTDLMYFMNNRVVDSSSETTTPNFIRILHRFHLGKEYNDETVYALFLKMCYNGDDEGTLSRMNRTILAMMTPGERDEFTTNY